MRTLLAFLAGAAIALGAAVLDPELPGALRSALGLATPPRETARARGTRAATAMATTATGRAGTMARRPPKEPCG